MGWWQKQIGKLARRAAKYAGIPLRDPALVAMLGQQPSSAGVDVDEFVALNYSFVWAATQVISSNVAALPPIPYEIRADGHYEAVDCPAYRMLLLSPNPEMTPYVFHETLQAHAMNWGNAYARLDRVSPDQMPSAMWPIPPNQIEPDRDETTGEVCYRFKAMYAGERDEILPWWQVLHIPGLGFDGLRGYNVIDMARESIGLGIASETYGGAFFGRGCTLGGILEAPEESELSDQAKKNLRESFELLHRGPDNSHRIAILEQGWRFNPTSMPPDTAQFLQTRAFQGVEVARWYNIPPHLLRDLDRATFSNVEQQSIEFFSITLRPWLLRWAQEYRRKLFGLPDQGRYFVKHDPHNVQMMDATSRFGVYAAGRNMGVYTLNDILKKEGMNPLPPEIGDVRLAPSTMKTLTSEPLDPACVTAAMNVLASLGDVDPNDAKTLLCSMIPNAPADVIDTLVRRLPEYKVPNATADSGTPV